MSMEKADLTKTSTQDLKDLLERQEKLLLDEKLVRALPDKGQRIRQHINQIQKILESRNSVEEAADRLVTMRLDGTGSREKEDSMPAADLMEFANQSSRTKVVVDHRPQHPVSHDIIMRRDTNESGRFQPNRLLKDKRKSRDPNKSAPPEVTNMLWEADGALSGTESVSSAVKSESPAIKRVADLKPSDTQTSSGLRLKHRYDASLEEMLPSNRRFNGVQVITVAESVNLIKDYEKSLKDAQLKQAEAMIAANTNVRLTADQNCWDGESFSRYRQKWHKDDGDSEEEEEEEEEDE